MMKKTFIILSILSTLLLQAQQSKNDEIKGIINEFFDAFHAKDSIKLNQFAGETIVMQTIAKNQEGKTYVRTNAYSEFVKGITSIPDSVKFKEKLTGMHIKVDEPMAHAWTPYEFWINGKFSHCGVNSFQLFKDEEQWKIIYLIDTRRRDNCVEE